MALLLLSGASALPAPQEVSNLMAPPQFQPPLKTLQEGLGEPAVVRETLEPRAGELPPAEPAEPAEPPKEKSPKEIIHQIDGSTFCFMVYKVGVEDEVVRYMFKNHIGVFACDDHTVFSLFDASDPQQPGCKYGGSMEDGCLIDGGGATSKPLVFNMSLLPPLDQSKAIGSWVAQEETTQVRQSSLIHMPHGKVRNATRLDWGDGGQWIDPNAGNDWGEPEEEKKDDKRTPAEKQADAERKIKKAEEEIKKAGEDAAKQTEADLDSVKKAQEENQKAADAAAADSAKAVADAQKDIDKAAKANEDAADSARAAAAKDVEDIEKAQKAAGAAAGAATKSAEHSLDDAAEAAGTAADAEGSAATASAASDMDAAKAQEKIASAAASARATESARAPADGEAATADGVAAPAAAPAVDCVSLDPTSVTDDWCVNTCGSAPALAAAAAGTPVCPEDMCVCGKDAEKARATAASESGSTFEDETVAESDAAEAAEAEKAAAEAAKAEDDVRIALFSNTPIFLAAWRQLFEKGTLFNHEWIVKVDADTMFLPDRLKDWLPVATPDPMRVSNCQVPIAANTPDASLTFGALEVINVAAARAYQLAMDECEASVPLDHGEDHFLHECATLGTDDWEVFSDAADSKGMVMDPACGTSFQAGCEFDSVSFHPYQDLKEFELCHNESKKVTRQQNKDAAESWTAAGGDDGVQTGAHHGAYEKNGLKTVKKPARAV